jgi:hypothetical protein
LWRCASSSRNPENWRGNHSDWKGSVLEPESLPPWSLPTSSWPLYASMLPGASTWTTGTEGSGAPARLPPWTSLNHRVPELIRPHIRKPLSPSCRVPISARCGSEATESRLSSLGSKDSERGNASRCRLSGGLPSGSKSAGSARMARKTTRRSSSRNMLAW